MIPLGGGPKKRDRALLPVMEEVVAVHDLVTGRELTFAKESPGDDVPNYLVISTDAIEPGGGRVLIVSGRGEEGRFLTAPVADETPFTADEAP